MFFWFSCRTPIYLRAQEATAVEWFQEVQTAKVTDGWLGEGTRIPNTPIYVRNCYKKMRDLLFNEESLRNIDKQTYVVKGTPGIGKTTMLYYLPSECLSEALHLLLCFSLRTMACSLLERARQDGILKPSSAEAKCIRTELEKPSAWWMLHQTARSKTQSFPSTSRSPAQSMVCIAWLWWPVLVPSSRS